MRYALMLFVSLFLCVPAFAENTSSEDLSPMKIIYAHVGEDKAGETAGGVGFLSRGTKSWALGLDFGIEGEAIDQTRWRNAETSGWSLNLLLGYKIVEGDGWEIIPFGLAGIRAHKYTCPAGQSYLGFDCYADTDSETDWKGNFGGGLIMQIGRVSFGVRATGESTTGIIGWRF